MRQTTVAVALLLMLVAAVPADAQPLPMFGVAHPWAMPTPEGVQAMRAIGATVVRRGLRCDGSAPADDAAARVYAEAGVRVIWIIYRACSVREVVQRAAQWPGQMWQLENEPNLSWDAGDYAQWARVRSEAIRGVDRTASLLGPAIGGTDEGAAWAFLRRILAFGYARDVDALAIQPYWWWPDQLEAGVHRWREEFRSTGLPLIITEYGQTVTGRSEQWQADQAVVTRLACERAGISAIWHNWRDERNDPNDPEQNFGLLDAEGRAKPAYVALEHFAAGRP